MVKLSSNLQYSKVKKYRKEQKYVTTRNFFILQIYKVTKDEEFCLLFS